MERFRRSSAVAVLSPVDAKTLDGLTVAEGLGSTCGGDPARLRAMLREIAESDEGRVAIGLGNGARIVAYACATTPGAETRLYSVAPAVELAEFEVAVPDRRRGVFTGVFHALFRHDLEESIVYVVADPRLSQRKESVRAFRDRLEATLGSVGFAPMPTDDRRLHPHADATFFARVGRAVPTPDVEDFFKRLRTSAYASVAISLREPFLRNLLRDDLERSGFHVCAVASGGVTNVADIAISDSDGAAGRVLTVRLNGGVEIHSRGETIWYPSMELDRLPGVLRAELELRRGVHA